MTHEFGIVQTIVGELLQQLKRDQVEQVERVCFRRASAFSEDALRQEYKALAVGTPLENAELMVETVGLRHKCGCGYKHVLISDDLVGHIFICPICGAIREVYEVHNLELIEVVAAQELVDA